MRTFLFLVAFILLSAINSFADSPDNLDIVWARVARANTPIYAQASSSSALVSRYAPKHVLNVAGFRDTPEGRWFEVVWPFKGWLKAKDAWFASGSYRPDSLSVAERLGLRLETDLGNWPGASEQQLGKARKSDYQVRGEGAGAKVTLQALTWPGLIIVYENSYKNKALAWISKVGVGQGGRASFGPVRTGDSTDKLKLLDNTFDGRTDGEFCLDDGPHHFRFLLRAGHIEGMGYSYGPDPEFPTPPASGASIHQGTEPAAGSTQETGSPDELKRLAKVGDATAANHLGVCYEKGTNGLAVNLGQAVHWYTIAARAGSGLALHNLGDCYRKGRGVKADSWKAFEYYQKAAATGLAKGYEDVGDSLGNDTIAEGLMMDKKLQQAVAARWYAKALAHGCSGASAKLARMGFEENVAPSDTPLPSCPHLKLPGVHKLSGVWLQNTDHHDAYGYLVRNKAGEKLDVIMGNGDLQEFQDPQKGDEVTLSYTQEQDLDLYSAECTTTNFYVPDSGKMLHK